MLFPRIKMLVEAARGMECNRRRLDGVIVPSAIRALVRNPPMKIALAIAATLWLAGHCRAVESPLDAADFSAELSRIQPVEPDLAAATMTVQPGFQFTLVAAEPLVASPVAMAWDEQGRLFIVEMRGYSEHRNEKLSRIRLLVDEDDDGLYDSATIYADGLLWPTAVACWNGGIFVGDAPEILYLKDADGDGVSEIRQRVFSGFGIGNVQGLLNSFVWGVDNRLHGAASSSGGEIRPVADLEGRPRAAEGAAVNVQGRDFSLDPLLLDFRAETGGAQHGLGFDDWGRKFVCHNSDHAIRCMAEDRYLARNPFYAAPRATMSIAADGGQAPIFRSSPVEPWRIVRSRLRAASADPRSLEGGGKPAGYFTSATGITPVRGDAFGPSLYGMLLVGDVGSNVIHRKRLNPLGVEQAAERVDQQSELVASSDIWFRPAQFANGPDGAIYAADVYREVIEHPDSLPTVIKKHLDLDSGRDRGRIWRLAPAGWTHRKTPNIAKASLEEKVKLLSHANAWHRESAARLLHEQNDSAAEQPLRALVRDPAAEPRARMHAAYLLDGMRRLGADDVLACLESREPMLRCHAVRLSERFLGSGGAPSPETTLIEAIRRAVEQEHDAVVRYQLAFTLGMLPDQARLAGLTSMLMRDGADRWIRMAAFTSLKTDACEVLGAIIAQSAAQQSAAPEGVLSGLVGQVGTKAAQEELTKLIALLDGMRNDRPGEALALLVELNHSLTARGRSLADTVPADSTKHLTDALIAWAREKALDTEASIDARALAIRGLSLGSFEGVAGPLVASLSSLQPREIALAALDALDAHAEEAVAVEILAAWPTLSPDVRRRAAEVLLGQKQRAVLLLNALETGRLSTSDFERSQLDALTRYPDVDLRERAARLLLTVNEPQRGEVVESYREMLGIRGDRAIGKTVFEKNCSACHRVEGVGNEIGPNLSTMKARGAEVLLVNVLDPNREVNPQYLSYSVVTKDGRVHGGLISAESAASLTLRTSDGREETILRDSIEHLQSSGKSLMPEGLEKQIDPKSMADLFEFLLNEG